MRKTPDAPGLTRAQIHELEAELRAELARLERTIRADADDGQPESWSANDTALGNNTTEHLGLATVPPSRAAARKAGITDALKRIADQTYGICMSCERPIPYGRLIAMPETAHCVSCGARW
ncbi:MAG TPA: TraR/DksA C4-type zinc finger protein [Gemmatimonadaceae bacterium]